MPAVAKAHKIFSSEKSKLSCILYNTAGNTPQLPQVGAVTISPPEAFSSATAKAYENNNVFSFNEPVKFFAFTK